MAHKCRAISQEQIKGLPVGKMAIAITDPPLQMDGIGTILEHVLIVIRFQEGGMTLLEIGDQLLARNADIREYADLYFSAGHDKTIGVGRIMEFREGRDHQLSDGDRLVRPERNR